MFSINLYAGDLKAGDKAPDFKLADQNGKIHTLNDYEGRKLVLYFYPKDDTPGCTKEACNLRDNYSALTDSGVAILGVSHDDSASHSDFSKKYDLPFPLLSDTEEKVTELYGVNGLLFIKRTTFLVDEKGYIQHIFRDVETGRHANQILSVLKKE